MLSTWQVAYFARVEHNFDGGGAGALDDVTAGGKTAKCIPSTGRIRALLTGVERLRKVRRPPRGSG